MKTSSALLVISALILKIALLEVVGTVLGSYLTPVHASAPLVNERLGGLFSSLPREEQIYKIVTFMGKPGVTSQAAIVELDLNTEPNLIITHQRADKTDPQPVLQNNSLSLAVGGLNGTQSTLEVSPRGALLIKQQNETIGRDRWSRTLTVTYVKDRYVVSRFFYSYLDTLSGQPRVHCDYNLLTGQGIHKGKQVVLKTKPFDLARLQDSEALYTCLGW